MFCVAKRAWNNRSLAIVRDQRIQSQLPSYRKIIAIILPPFKPQHCNFCATSQASNKRRIITYLTDVEGDAAYLDRYVEQSKVLTFRKIKPRPEASSYFPYERCIDFVNDHSVLVFGGDIWDRGGSDLYCIRQLLDLRQRYGPERVYFVMGNRDINKMRIVQEMGLEGQERLPTHGGIYWMRGTGMQGDPDLFFDESNRNPSKLVPQTNAAERLNWMLGKTMGSPNAFELRRKELETEKRCFREISTAVSDEDVAKSYRESCHPSEGEMGRYLSQANLALRLGNILFLHGALPLTHKALAEARREDGSPLSNDDSKRFWNNFDFAMPWRKAAERKDPVTNANDWFRILNEFAQRNLDAWKENISDMEKNAPKNEHGGNEHESEVWSTLGGYHQWTKGKPYGALMQYGMGWTPNRDRNPTVVYSSWLTNGTPSRFNPNSENPEDDTFSQLTKEFFNVTGLELICSGHQPHGDLPFAIRVENDSDRKTPSWILCCDTSYSGDTMWINDERSLKERSNAGRGRGSSGRGEVAVCEVLIEQCTSSGTVVGVHCHGRLSDGSKYETVNILKDEVPVGQLAESRRTPNLDDDNTRDFWIKAQFTDGSYLITTGEGYDVWNYVVDA